MRITDYAELIRFMPYREQAFDIKYEIWKGSNQSQIIEKIFENKSKKGIITISRNDLLLNHCDLEEFVIKVIMWGYPRKGMYGKMYDFIKSEDFKAFIQKLKDVDKSNIYDINEIKKLLKCKGLKLSSLSKILYFMNVKVESYSTLILDRRVINALNSGRFVDPGIEQFSNLSYENAVQNYKNYLKFMHSLAEKMNTEADRVEMFLYEFGSNLKELTAEKVFEILGEGGEICISRQIDNSGTKFIYHHNEFDPTNEGLGINKKNEYDNFEQVFQLINDRYPWYLLHLKTIHDDYKKLIIERLIEKLNHKSILIEDFEYHKGNLENSLKIRLNYSMNKHTNKLTWSYDKLK